MDRNILDEIQNKSFHMMDAYKSFVDYMAALKDRDYEEDLDDEQMAMEEDLRDSSDDEDGLLMAMDEWEDDSEDSEDLDYDCEDFPGREYFTLDDIEDVDSGRFYAGARLGIPKAVAVRQNDNQGRLLPIRNGLFTEEY